MAVLKGRKENPIMKITRESWLKATAKAMSTDSAKTLFKSDSEFEDLFIDYSFYLYTKLKGKTITESEYKETIVEINTERGTETLSSIVNMVLYIFARQIWKNLTEQIAQDECNTEYENYKSVLKSQKSE